MTFRRRDRDLFRESRRPEQYVSGDDRTRTKEVIAEHQNYMESRVFISGQYELFGPYVFGPIWAQIWAAAPSRKTLHYI